MSEESAEILRNESSPSQTACVDSKETSKEHDEAKYRAIEIACQVRNVEALVQHATTSGGLLADTLRQAAWPILLGCDRSKENLPNNEPDWRDLQRHDDEDQIKLDVDRSFVYYPQCGEKELDRRKEQLSDLIIETLRRNPMLCYFQGYHDIAQVLLLVLGAQLAHPTFATLSLVRIRDYMLPSLSPALKHLHLIPAILEVADPRIRRHLASTQPYFALAAALTLYAHDIEDYRDIARLYDFLLAHEPVVTIYLFAAIILSRKDELLDIPIEEPEMLHFTLSKMPQPLALEELISSTMELYRQHPPESLPFRVWRRIPQSSVLKTSRTVGEHVDLRQAVEYFRVQAQKLRREEFRKRAYTLLWQYRRPLSGIGVAILVGLASIYIRKSGIDRSMWSYIRGFRHYLSL